MTPLREAAQQALEALYEETAWFGPTPKGAAAIAALRAALAQQAESPCACWPSQMCSRQAQEPDDIKKQLANALDSAEFYRRRCEALQSWQSKMRDPERIIVCDILANGKTLDPAFAGDRYTAPPQKAEPAQEPVAWVYTGIKQDGTEHGPHLVWKPEYMDAMSASKGAKATPLYFAPPRQPEPAQEPVAWMVYTEDGKSVCVTDNPNDLVGACRALPLYTAPPQRKPLTEEEIRRICDAHWSLRQLARAIERAHGIKE